MAKFMLTFCLAVLVGCASVGEINVKDKFEKTTRAYRQALQWGEWTSAKKYLQPGDETGKNMTLAELKQIKVTSYEVNDVVASEDNLQARQSVEIRYYHVSRMVEKTLVDNQVWTYQEETGWRLTSGLPKF